jgi:hypothetical protein
MTDCRVIVCLSDLHCGSVVGLHPPGFETVTSQEGESKHIPQNGVQQWLWDAWLAFWQQAEDIIGLDTFALVYNGDLIEGYHHKTTQVWDIETKNHCAAFELIHATLPMQPSRLFITAGTECHTGSNEFSLARSLKAEGPAGPGAWARLDMDVAGVPTAFRHHISTTSRQYLEGSALSIALGIERLEAARVGLPMPRVVVASHCHIYRLFNDGHGLCLTLPSWQLLTRYGHKVVPASRPRVGGVILDYRSCESSNPSSLPDVYPLLFSPPPTRRVVLSASRSLGPSPSKHSSKPSGNPPSPPTKSRRAGTPSRKSRTPAA